MTTLGETLLQKLANWRPDNARQVLRLDHPDTGWLVDVEADAVDGRDAGVLQLTRYLRLLHEAPLEVRQVAVVLAQHLEGDGALERRVAGAQHDAHAAAGDLAQDGVAAGLADGRLPRGGRAVAGGQADRRDALAGRRDSRSGRRSASDAVRG